MGWVAGVAYAKPQLGILASLTYRSEIDHIDIIYELENDVTLTLPESINLTAQTGLSPTSAVFTRMRYIPWSDFEYRPTVLNQTTKSLLGDGLPFKRNKIVKARTNRIGIGRAFKLGIYFA